MCRSRNLPVITFLNKFDRPSRDPLELLDEIETQIDLRPTPATWPVGDGEDFRCMTSAASSQSCSEPGEATMLPFLENEGNGTQVANTTIGVQAASGSFRPPEIPTTI